MATIDYEKKYKKALGWMQSLYNGLHGKMKEEAERYFTELAFCEDERIRNFLHHTFTVQYLAKDKLGKWHGEPVSNILAWLEKQGEQGTNGNEREFPISEQKPTWSEEDEKMLKDTIRFCELCGNQVSANWLKSLRPQNVWISVDEEVYVKEPVLAQKKDKSDQFKGYVVCCDHTLVPNIYERYMVLGNIVSQSTWKPSEEQMIAINTAINVLGKGTLNGKQLIELQEQLKKLKEA